MTALSDYFKGTASKYLSAVDATPTSNQHEIGSNKFTAILGNPGSEKLRFRATFVFFNPDLEEPETCTDTVTYYDTRVGQANRGPEFRLYYRDNPITERLQEGDFCLVAMCTNSELMIAVARHGSDSERRLRFLFDVDEAQKQWVIGKDISSNDLDLASRSILEALGIEIKDSAEELLGRLIDKFGMKFPPTYEFSAFARESLGSDISPHDCPDETLEAWMRQEERLFRTLERAIVKVRLAEGFVDVDPFISFSLSVQNRRKSRVGHALENHLEAIFKEQGIQYQKGVKTEGNAKPDFLFPNSAAYADQTVQTSRLRMLAAKTTCKDRWRQILTEAERISPKHLFTLETAISENQTDEMAAHNVCLVVPPSVAKTYTQGQQNHLLSLNDFTRLVR